jgi:hypothetical protein
VAARDPESRYRAADRRLRGLLFGDGTYTAGIARGEENRDLAARELRLMRSAFEEALARAAEERAEQAEARVADLEEELRRLAASRSRKARKATGST